MTHIAIMQKSWKLIPQILNGKKTVESRWYKNKVAPWGKIKTGDTVYFKNTGEKVSAKAQISTVEQFENIDEVKRLEILRKYALADLGSNEISQAVNDYTLNKNYCLIIHLKNPQTVKPFAISKKGFGAMSAWICVEDIEQVKYS